MHLLFSILKKKIERNGKKVLLILIKKDLVLIILIKKKVNAFKRPCNLRTSRCVPVLHTFDNYVQNNSSELCFDNSYSLQTINLFIMITH